MNWVVENIKEIMFALGGLSGIGAYLDQRNKRIADKREYQAKINQLETANNKSIMDLYQEALDDLKKRYDEKFHELHKEIDELREKLKTANDNYANLLTKYNNIKKQI